jgi:flagellar hook assembly protein FlgD
MSNVPSQRDEFRPEGENSRFAENPRLSDGTQFTELKIYDVTGRLVKNFSLPTSHFSLPTSVVWDGTDDIGRRVPQGVYFVRFVAVGHSGTTGPAGTNVPGKVNYEKTEKVIFVK